MRIVDAINETKALKPSSYTQTDMIRWLSRLDWTIKREIIDTHSDGENVTYSGYDTETDIETVMLIPDPYSEAYVYWLEAQIDYANGEIGRYNNSMSMFETARSAYERYYNRLHMPLGKKLKII